MLFIRVSSKSETGSDTMPGIVGEMAGPVVSLYFSLEIILGAVTSDFFFCEECLSLVL